MPKDDWAKQYGDATAEQLTNMLLAAWSSPKWKEAEKLALQIRDNPNLTNSEKGYMQAKALEWPASP